MRKAIGLLLRIYSYLYHSILCLFLLGIAIVASSTGTTLNMAMLPWDGDKLTQILIAMSVIGLICVVGAVTGLFRWLFPIWALVVLILMVRGFFLGSFNFADADQFKGVVWLTIGALGAFLSSLSLYTKRP